MTTKERNLASILGGVLGVLLAGVAGYMFVYSPYQDATAAAKKRKDEVDDLELKTQKILLDKNLFEHARQQSLPADPKFSRGHYATFLETLGRKADIAPAAMKVSSADPDTKSGLIPGTKKLAYTKLAYTVTVRADLYRITDLLRHFYQQPLLHAIKSISVQKPSDATAQRNKELDVTLAIEALVLDGAPDRPSLLPVAPAVGLMSGAAVQTAYNWTAVATGAGAPVPVTGVLADQKREYLAIAGKNPFYGPPPRKAVEPDAQADYDSTAFITLNSLVSEDGRIQAVFRDKLTNNNYTVTQTPAGAITVMGEFELNGKVRTAPGYRASKDWSTRDLMYGTEEGMNQRAWRVRRVTETEVILEKLDLTGGPEKAKAPLATLFGGGPAAFVAVPEGKVFRVALGQSLGSPSTLLTREAWRTIYARAKPPVSATPVSPVSPASQETPPADAVTVDRDR